MQTKRTYTILETIWWTRIPVLVLTLISTTVVVLYELVHIHWIKIPWLPISMIGVAVAFVVGFKNNSSYGRQWEARQIYGAMVNCSRSWGAMVLNFVTDEFAQDKPSKEEIAKVHQKLIYRHIAWLTSLRYQLRQWRSWEHNRLADLKQRALAPESLTKLEEWLPDLLAKDEMEYVLSKNNPCVHLLRKQSDDLQELKSKGLIDDFRHMELQKLITDLYTQQGKAERIKNYPFPRQYATVNLFSVWLFVFMLPCGMLSAFDQIGEGFVWMTIPFSIIVGWIFVTMELIGDYSENPFEGLWNDVPISTLSHTMEVDLREMLNETALPNKLEPVRGIQY